MANAGCFALIFLMVSYFGTLPAEKKSGTYGFSYKPYDSYRLTLKSRYQFELPKHFDTGIEFVPFERGNTAGAKGNGYFPILIRDGDTSPKKWTHG